MSDQGVWFKLWIGADEDPDLGDFSLEDFGRWCKFGLYLKKFGTLGVIELKPPCLPLQNKLKVSSFEDVLTVLRKFPNCSVTGETNVTVTWKNWSKYQGDNSTARVRRYRQSVTAKKRREEMRGEEKNLKSPAQGAGPVPKEEKTVSELFAPQVKRAVRLAGEDQQAQRKMTQWVLFMAHCLKLEPYQRTLAVVTASLDQIEAKIKSGYTITSLWGLLTTIFDKERVKYIQGAENEAHKTVPIPSRVAELMKGIA